jgi:N-acetylglucosamine malate deacetylase 2
MKAEKASAEEICAALCEAAPGRGPSAIVVAAHFDDEVIGVGARFSRFSSLTLIHATDGSPKDMWDATRLGFSTREAYSRERRAELACALKIAGVEEALVLEAGFPDKEASLHLAELARYLAATFEELRPEAVLANPYEGGHPDHDACAFGVQEACRLLERKGSRPPARIEYASYHACTASPRGLAVFDFLPARGSRVYIANLTPEERPLKRRMIECFHTQSGILEVFPVEVELYRPAPLYDFTQPPHEGPCYYDAQEWGVKSDEFRRLSRQALLELA